MDAVIMAGGIPQPGDPLYEYTQGGHKALLDICGKPMIQWVLDALANSCCVDQIVIIGLPDGSALNCSKPLSFLPNQGEMLENIFAGVKQVATLNPAAHHVLLASSDIPAITPEMVDWLARTAAETDHDVYYNVITRQVMEARYPGSRRTYTHLKGMEVCGGDMNVVRAQTTTGKDDLWRKIIAARKSPLKQAALVGFDNVILLLLRLMSIDEAVKRASQRTGLRARVLRCPYAEIGMDVDKPHQLELMRADMTKRLQVAG